MRAAVVPTLGPAEVIEVRNDWPHPGPPGPGEALIAADLEEPPPPKVLEKSKLAKAVELLTQVCRMLDTASRVET